MIKYLVVLIAFIVTSPLTGQVARHLKVKYDNEGKYTLEFDVKAGKNAPEGPYKVIIKAKNKDLVVQPISATGAGLYHPIEAGKSYRILWYPAKEDLPNDGWGFHVKLVVAEPKQEQIENKAMDHPLAITASYLFIFSAIYLINILNH